MMIDRRRSADLAAILGVSLLLAACGGRDVTGEATPEAPAAAITNWRAVATTADRARLRNWREAWTTGIDRARRTDAAKIAAQGVLFDADRALAGPVPPPGNYRCRVFKLGAQGTAMAEFTSYPDFDCTIENRGGVSQFYKNNGAQRATGTIFNGDASRAVFLGTLQLGDEGRPMDYGRDNARDLAGLVDRIGERRWRIILPYPQFESVVDVIELVPQR